MLILHIAQFVVLVMLTTIIRTEMHLFLLFLRFGPYFCQPVIAGLSDENKPFICTMDSIDAKELEKDFVVVGTASESLYGACESMFKPDMEAEELAEVVSQALLSSVDRDCLSGWGGHVYVV